MTDGQSEGDYTGRPIAINTSAENDVLTRMRAAATDWESAYGLQTRQAVGNRMAIALADAEAEIIFLRAKVASKTTSEIPAASRANH